MEHDPIAAAARRLNLNATFYPAGDTDNDHPCIEIGGVQVYAYIDELGRLRISIDTETSELPVRYDGTTPMLMCVNEAVVLDDTGDEALPCGADRRSIPDSYVFADQFRMMHVQS